MAELDHPNGPQRQKSQSPSGPSVTGIAQNQPSSQSSSSTKSKILATPNRHSGETFCWMPRTRPVPQGSGNPFPDLQARPAETRLDVHFSYSKNLGCFLASRASVILASSIETDQRSRSFRMCLRASLTAICVSQVEALDCEQRAKRSEPSQTIEQSLLHDILGMAFIAQVEKAAVQGIHG